TLPEEPGKPPEEPKRDGPRRDSPHPSLHQRFTTTFGRGKEEARPGNGDVPAGPQGSSAIPTRDGKGMNPAWTTTTRCVLLDTINRSGNLRAVPVLASRHKSPDDPAASGIERPGLFS